MDGHPVSGNSRLRRRPGRTEPRLQAGSTSTQPLPARRCGAAARWENRGTGMLATDRGTGGVAEWFRQGPAKPCTAVRIRSPPPGRLHVWRRPLFTFGLRSRYPLRAWRPRLVAGCLTTCGLLPARGADLVPKLLLATPSILPARSHGIRHDPSRRNQTRRNDASDTSRMFSGVARGCKPAPGPRNFPPARHDAHRSGEQACREPPRPFHKSYDPSHPGCRRRGPGRSDSSRRRESERIAITCPPAHRFAAGRRDRDL